MAKSNELAAKCCPVHGNPLIVDLDGYLNLNDESLKARFMPQWVAAFSPLAKGEPATVVRGKGAKAMMYCSRCNVARKVINVALTPYYLLRSVL